MASSSPIPGPGAAAGDSVADTIAKPIDGLKGNPSAGIFRNWPFVRLWAAQAISMTAQQAIWFAMLVVVEQVSGSSTQLSIAVLSTIVPAILIGLAAGAFVDRVNKKTVLVATNLLRAVAVLGYLMYGWSLYFVYAVNFIFVAISQFFGPAEQATIPALVPKRQLVAASSAFNITFTASQLVGIVLLAPWVIKLFGAPTLFCVSAVLYLVAGALSYSLPPGVKPEKSLSTLRRETLVRDVSHDVGEAWRFISSDAQTWRAMLIITLTSSLLLVFGMLTPRFVVDVLSILPEDAVFVLAPAFVGIFGVTTLLSRLVRRFGTAPLVSLGLGVLVLALAAMAGLQYTESWLLAPVAAIFVPIGLPFEHGLVPPMMLISLLLGAGYGLSSVPSQALLMERAPAQSRGRIFAVWLLLTNVASIVPIVFVGGVADLIGVSPTLGLVAALVLVSALYSILTTRGGPARATMH